jgi:hypothetical protein
VYVFFTLMGFYVDVERHTTDGRMDILMQTSDYIYILELKIDQSADVALQQSEPTLDIRDSYIVCVDVRPHLRTGEDRALAADAHLANARCQFYRNGILGLQRVMFMALSILFGSTRGSAGAGPVQGN